MNEAIRAFFLASMLFLAACSAAPAEEPPLAGARIGGPFTLTDQDGRQRSDSEFAGKYRLIYFGYSFCPDICPTDLQAMGQAMRLLERQEPAEAAKVQPIFITVDPARDTPAVMKEYVSAFHPRLIGLTGSEADVAKVTKQFGIYASKGETSPAGGYLVDHMRTTLLFGPQGEPIAIMPHDAGAEAYAAELKKWVS